MMRRQVKPFVTEYRGSTRRNKDLHLQGDLQSDPQAPHNRYADAEKVFRHEAPEDAYEAALRAADALFDGSSNRTATHGIGAVEPSAAEPIASFPLRLAKETANEVFADRSAESTANELAEGDTAVPHRRILQAIEPLSESRFAALEAERAPKRRGRRPGSKNKPKMVAADDWGAPRPASPQVMAPPIDPLIERLAERDDMSIVHPLTLGAHCSSATGEVEDDQQLPPQPRGRSDKFGWKRAGLRPGERWKRRLPKAAW